VPCRPSWSVARSVGDCADAPGGALKARARREERRTRRRAAAPLVFVGPKGGRLRRSNFRKFWNKARAAVGLDELHFHDLRHTGNTMAVPRKVPASAS
jgi:integrase